MYDIAAIQAIDGKTYISISKVQISAETVFVEAIYRLAVRTV